jgi:hypothetical protein
MLRSDIRRACTAQPVKQVLALFADRLDKRGSGGARRDRTDDLKLAKLALSQLSYGPIPEPQHLLEKEVVGLGRVELPTSRLSGVRSNHLSYRPVVA